MGSVVGEIYVRRTSDRPVANWCRAQYDSTASDTVHAVHTGYSGDIILIVHYQFSKKDRQALNDKKPIKISNGDATITFSDAGDITIKAKNIILDAQTKITIKSGSGDVETTAGANFKVTAKANAEIKGNGPSKLESSAILMIKGSMVKIN